ncbi:protein translocase subunit SecF [Sinimarinibacterium sp. CAU 1509]|uniref:protein translocase subunit SecF n=1 Tax=Sinimarinibacterium sp. CAU 1509 TaxID=2562283 RepID=UPI0010AD8B82|nr:protein translocase subunit SecF [Sinimarinibacterium sp. CAU 1509]TJY61945.1 protein translocase subunit SecF [Sinimarinibacterium sp. CAU 1509]
MKFFARVPNIDFMSQRKVGLTASTLLTLGAILLVLVRGLNLGIDFTGGVLVEVQYPQTVELDSVRSNLAEAGYERAVVQYFGASTAVLIRLPPAEDASSAQVSTNILHALNAEQNGISLRRIEFVGPQVGDELAEKGGLALLFAFMGIMIYIAFRFEWKFSVGAIAALIHDAVMVLGLLSLLQVEFDITTLAAILALIGYSNNETIVIFDRVRENLINQRKGDVLDIVNLSVNQTLLRSVITHLTTLLVLVALFFLGGSSVNSFSIAMIFGVIVATYSSIYVSTNLAVALGVSREDLLPSQDKEIDELP